MPDRAPSNDDAAKLYRDHVDDARRLATILVGPGEAEELVAESFARVIARLRVEPGSIADFRAYLHVTIRNGFRESHRRPSERPSSDQQWLLDTEVPPVDAVLDGVDADTAREAFATLPKSWQRVLWHLEVEGRKPVEAAQILGMRARAVSSLAHRAREGLRQAYLDRHLAGAPVGEGCAWARPRLSRHVRGRLTGGAQARMATHLDSCVDCSAAYLMLDQLNTRLAAYLFPIVLLGALPAAAKPAAWLAGGTVSASGGLVVPVPRTTTLRMTLATGAAAGALAVATGFVLSEARTDDPAAAVAPTATPPSAPAARPDPPKPAPVPAPEPVPPVTPPAPPQAPPQAPPPAPPQVAPQVAPPGPTPEKPEKATPTPEPEKPGPTVAAATTATPAETPAETPTVAPTVVPPVAVAPVAPTAYPVADCETAGRLVLPVTEGVRYELTEGDGRTGPWTVIASPEPGYRFASDAPTRFGGDLGQLAPCTRLGDVTVSPVDDHGPGRWRLSVLPEVDGGPARTLRVVVTFTRSVLYQHTSWPDGWSCPDGPAIGIATPWHPLTCTYAYDGAAPGPLEIRLRAPADAASPEEFLSEVLLYADESLVDTVRIAGPGPSPEP
ncbi:sigma-70 family RNA polymerase sigma factor [Nocardioides carbamazepini]|uniref:sigma-70 family RNA polymerase sigma factor n=1 Tax=Nocardioides carbamazepini TaxID=2854259 RepID=UPI0023547519|nr:sigma-70 family RNA polymerase sigma factor [Nocardioides carbamazepini]MCR1784586.1 sigma-70 family RNA polymerase sigma factor [Nocardioides carbamazepini]